MNTQITHPGIEHTEAFILRMAEPARLFGLGDYVLSQEQLLAMIRLAHKAGEVNQSERVLRKFDEMNSESARPNS